MGFNSDFKGLKRCLYREHDMAAVTGEHRPSAGGVNESNYTMALTHLTINIQRSSGPKHSTASPPLPFITFIVLREMQLRFNVWSNS